MAAIPVLPLLVTKVKILATTLTRTWHVTRMKVQNVRVIDTMRLMGTFRTAGMYIFQENA